MNEINDEQLVDEQSNLRKAIDEANQVKEVLDLGEAEAKDYSALFGDQIDEPTVPTIEPGESILINDPTANWSDLTNNVPVIDNVETMTDPKAYDPFAKWNHFKNGDIIEIIAPKTVEQEKIIVPTINEQLAWALNKDGQYEIVSVDNNIKYKIIAMLKPVVIGATQHIINNPIGKATKNGLNKIKSKMINFSLKHNLIMEKDSELDEKTVIDQSTEELSREELFTDSQINNQEIILDEIEPNIVEESPLNMIDGLKQIAVNQKLSLEAKILGGLVKIKTKKEVIINNAKEYAHTSVMSIQKSQKDCIENAFNKKNNLETQIRDYRERLFDAASKAEHIDKPIVEQIKEEPIIVVNQKPLDDVEPVVQVVQNPVIELLSSPPPMENQIIERSK